jgi:hypothetical protein
MDIVKTEPCSDIKVEGTSPLSEYPFFDIKDKDLVSVVKNEDMVRFAYVSQYTKEQSYI